LLPDALRKVGKLPEDEQDAIASQILATIEDEETWANTLRKNPARLRVENTVRNRGRPGKGAWHHLRP
jgi:hypothetical protein